MDKQSEALRLADESDNDDWIAGTNQWREEASAELRRLHQLNQELVEALKSVHSICKSDLQYRQFPSSREYEIINICEPLIAKHKEQA